jgi:hypothetical protein
MCFRLTVPGFDYRRGFIQLRMRVQGPFGDDSDFHNRTNRGHVKRPTMSRFIASSRRILLLQFRLLRASGAALPKTGPFGAAWQSPSPR